MQLLLLIYFFLLLPATPANASGYFPIDNKEQIIIGAKRAHTVRAEETLIELARKYDVGYNEIVSANPGIDPWVPGEGTRITVPTVWLIPQIMDKGILINLAEMRLYFFFKVKGSRYLKTHPIGIGVQGSGTPTGNFRITVKVKDPVWNVPVSIRKEDPGLPAFVPPGPDNPLGGYWLNLSVNGYGIHGTNRPLGIGRRVSHGCIRLYPEDIESLFGMVRPGTSVRIIDEPVKVGAHKDRVYIEVHGSGLDYKELVDLAVKKLSRKRLLKYVDTMKIISAVKSATGLPARISE